MQYLINEMAIHCLKVATDPNGSRVLQSCLLLYQGEYRVHLFAEIIANALHLAQDRHGFVSIVHVYLTGLIVALHTSTT